MFAFLAFEHNALVNCLHWGRKGYFCDAVINRFCCLWILINWRTVLWIVIETWTTKILDCVHVHWRSIEENKLFIWTKDWFKFTFESFDVTSHFTALSPTNSWLPQRIPPPPPQPLAPLMYLFTDGKLSSMKQEWKKNVYKSMQSFLLKIGHSYMLWYERKDQFEKGKE